MLNDLEAKFKDKIDQNDFKEYSSNCKLLLEGSCEVNDVISYYFDNEETNRWKKSIFSKQYRFISIFSGLKNVKKLIKQTLQKIGVNYLILQNSQKRFIMKRLIYDNKQCTVNRLQIDRCIEYVRNQILTGEPFNERRLSQQPPARFCEILVLYFVDLRKIYPNNRNSNIINDLAYPFSLLINTKV